MVLMVLNGLSFLFYPAVVEKKTFWLDKKVVAVEIGLDMKRSSHKSGTKVYKNSVHVNSQNPKKIIKEKDGKNV